MLNETPLRRQRFALWSRSLERSNPATHGARGILCAIAAAALLFSASFSLAADPAPAAGNNDAAHRALEAQIGKIEERAEKNLTVPPAQGDPAPELAGLREPPKPEPPPKPALKAKGKGKGKRGNSKASVPAKKQSKSASGKAKKSAKIKKSREVPMAPVEVKFSDRVSNSISYLSADYEMGGNVPSIIPLKGNGYYLSATYGWRKSPFKRKRKAFHYGLDIAGNWKTPIIAPADGVVEASRYDKQFGNVVWIRHEGGLASGFAHMAVRAAKVGQQVTRGTVLGYMGRTGRATGVHLHYMMTRNDRYIDPLPYLGASIPRLPSMKFASEQELATDAEAMENLSLLVAEAYLGPGQEERFNVMIAEGGAEIGTTELIYVLVAEGKLDVGATGCITALVSERCVDTSAAERLNVVTATNANATFEKQIDLLVQAEEQSALSSNVLY